MQEKFYIVYQFMRFTTKLIYKILILILINCTNKEFEPYYYILNSHLRSGFNKPEKVKNIQVNYEPDLFIIELRWDPSRDPDTNQNVLYYYIYLYYEYPQYQHYYDKKYLFDITTETQYSFNTGSFRGFLYFIITAFDSGSESEISEIIQIRVL